MAYTITLYCSSGGVAPGEALEQIIAGCGGTAGVQLYAASPTQGDEWTAANVGSTPEQAQAGNVNLELHTSDALVRRMIEQISDEDAPHDISSADMVAILTLSRKEIDWPAVGAAWRSMEQLWRTIPYDDVSGFDVSVGPLG